MEVLQIIQLTTIELKEIMAEAVAEGVQAGIVRAKETLAGEQPINQQAFMKLAGYRDQASFRTFCKDNRIEPYEVKARRNYYLPSQLRGIQRTKGIHLK